MPHPARKLSPEQAADIRYRHALKMRLVAALESAHSKKAMAAEFGVAETTIDLVVRGMSYKKEARQLQSGA